ncbi:MAG: peptidoglycan-binding domain-containing protein [Minisyncoccota bacterium]
MNKFRDFTRIHLSKHTLHALLVVGVVGLGFSGHSFYLGVEATLAELEAESIPMPVLASAHFVVPFPTTPPPSLEVPDRSLAIGETSREVLLLQEFLNWRGFWIAEEEITAHFGEATQEAVKRYQKSIKIVPEGIVGPKTREAWRNDLERAI